mmetsp:Transcript_24438/g.33563  ORF Transcript_24438/g.33563 Transcript_24438/m.33563 type:complete len:132 (+) Transcript_24438:145-540(+)
MISAISVIGQANNPLYIRTFNSNTDELKFHYLIHASLDLVEDRINLSNETYLGLLYPSEDFKVYGYATATNVKFLIVVDAETTESVVRSFFDTFHTMYCNMVCNPFYSLGDNLTSIGFEHEVATLVSQSAQ